MMNSAPAVVGASDGLAAFMSIIAKKGTRSCLGAGCGAAFQRACSLRNLIRIRVGTRAGNPLRLRLQV